MDEFWVFLGILANFFSCILVYSLRSCPLPIIPLSLSREEGVNFFPLSSQRSKEAKKKKKTPDLRLTGIPLPHLADPASRRRKNSEYGIKLEGFVRVLKMRHWKALFYLFHQKVSTVIPIAK